MDTQENPEKRKEVKWYQRNISLITAFFVLGPLMLPLVWYNPRFSTKTKTILTIVIIGFTLFITWGFYKSVVSIYSVYQKELGI